jgi:hypothetical protein
MKILILLLFVANSAYSWEYVFFNKSGETKIVIFDVEEINLHNPDQGPASVVPMGVPFSDPAVMATLETARGVGYSIPGWYYNHTPSSGGMIASQSIYGSGLVKVQFSYTVLTSGAILPETFMVVLSGNMPALTFDYVTPSLHENLYAMDAGYKYDAYCDCSMWVWDVEVSAW